MSGSNGSGGGSRRRGQALEQAIFDAVWNLLAESGYEQLSMAAVAERAQTSKPVLYRRWADRADLTLAALRHKVPSPRFPDDDHGDLRSDLIALLLPLADWLVDTPPEIVRSLRTAVLNDPELVGAMQSRMPLVDVGPALVQVMARAAARGEVRGGVLPPRAVRLPAELMRAEAMRAMPVPERVVEEIVDQILLPLFTAL
jgi:AcrR family transcriptional regulator